MCICNDNQAPTNEQSPQRTFASNWSILTFIVSVLGAAGGLLVAATLKYADSILKTLATAGAIVISTVLGHYFLNGPLDLVIVIGALTAIIAIADYTLDSTPSYIELMTPKDLEKQ
jgi:UDP-sugar transporter A1/2/3